MGSHPLPRTSKRTVLRRLGVSDLADFQAYRCDPEVARYQDWQVQPDTKARSFLADVHVAELLVPGHWCQIGIADRSTDALIGDVGICVAADQDQAEIGFSMARHAQRKGLASEAVLEAIQLIFEHSDVSRIIGITDARNLPSVRLLERVGMHKYREQETVFRDEPCIEYFFTVSCNEVFGLE
ncbi:MAG: GNAT family N-acetyltransferase [Geminicoccaceae bacterium]